MYRQEELLREGEEGEMGKLKGGQQWKMEDRLQSHSCPTLMEHTFASLKVQNLKVPMWAFTVAYK